MPTITDQLRTKSGAKRHREGCRFVRVNAFLCEDNPIDRKLTPCAVCKPHMAAKLLPDVIVRDLGPCGVCLKGHEGLGRHGKAEAEAAGFKVTKTGTKYHTAECKHAGGKGVKVAAKVRKIKPSQTVAPAAA